MRMHKAFALGTLAIALGLAGGASAAEVEVKMLNRGTAGVMVFEPALVRINPGDTVRFVATDKGHDVESIDAMLPTGTQHFGGRINQDVTVTFETPGVYGYKCLPHYGMGMVGLVVVGTPTNIDQARTVNHPGRAKQVFAGLLDQAAATP